MDGRARSALTAARASIASVPAARRRGQEWANNGLSRCTPALLNPPEQGHRGWHNAAVLRQGMKPQTELIASLFSFASTQERDEEIKREMGAHRQMGTRCAML
jgi:hypothetical protein